MIGRVAYHLLVPLIAGGICGVAIPFVLILLSIFGFVPASWVTDEVSTRTLSIMFAVAAVVVFYLPVGSMADSALHSLASRGWPVLRRPPTNENSKKIG